MNHKHPGWRVMMGLILALGGFFWHALAQPADGFPPFGPGGGPMGGRGFNRGPGGPGGGLGPDGMGGVQERYALVSKFDKNNDQRLDAAERKAAREFIQQEKAAGRGPRLPGPGPMRRAVDTTPPPPGPSVSPADVPKCPDKPLYDLGTVRTLFFYFENQDWEQELEDFYHTDVDVPARLVVDGREYRDVGMRFRGASSYFTVPRGYKRSLNVSLDFAHDEQRLMGVRTLNLLNSHNDPSYLRSVLYLQAAREYVPAPEANLVHVVINGESWGIFVNVEQFNKDFIKKWFGTTHGARWKVPGSPQGRGGLEYLGDKAEPYKKIYEIKSKDEPASWEALIRLCRVLNQTPTNELEKALAPLLEVDGVLKFLALENVFINNDGYWTRASDYNLYLDEKGRFHVLPYDSNETFQPAMRFGPMDGGRRGLRGGGNPARGVELEPLAGADDPRKPLLSKLLAVPALRERYLKYVRQIAEKHLDWKKIEPLATALQKKIAPIVKADTHKLESYQAFERSLAYEMEGDTSAAPPPLAGGFGPPGFRGPPGGNLSLKNFVVQRRVYLLEATARP
ncbi:MAG: CotH kinase family protein [Verrucomicrobiae bacterium]|nr:CotH kinase family protein [Verrucomicrobiae bacterium]